MLQGFHMLWHYMFAHWFLEKKQQFNSTKKIQLNKNISEMWFKTFGSYEFSFKIKRKISIEFFIPVCNLWDIQKYVT